MLYKRHEMFLYSSNRSFIVAIKTINLSNPYNNQRLRTKMMNQKLHSAFLVSGEKSGHQRISQHIFTIIILVKHPNGMGSHLHKMACFST